MNDFFDRSAWMLDPDAIYLNHGSFGAVTRVVAAEQDRWRIIQQSNPNGFFTRVLPGGLEAVRVHAADFVRADATAVVLQPNVTWAAATVLSTVPLGPGDEVLITDDTYEAVRAAAVETCVRTGAMLIQAALPPLDAADGRAVIAAVEARLSARTRLAIVDHIASTTAALTDAAAIVRSCRANSTTVFIDGAHAPGMLDLDVDAIGADFYAGNFHKWCCAPLGSAFLAVSPEWRERVRSPVAGSESFRGFPTGLEWWGTVDYSALLATPFALEVLREVGVDALRERNTKLVNRGAALVAAALGQSPPPLSSLAMITLPLPPRLAWDEESSRALRGRVAEDIGAEVMTTMARGKPALRLSAQAYNGLEDYRRLAASLASPS